MADTCLSTSLSFPAPQTSMNIVMLENVITNPRMTIIMPSTCLASDCTTPEWTANACTKTDYTANEISTMNECSASEISTASDSMGNEMDSTTIEWWTKKMYYLELQIVRYLWNKGLFLKGVSFFSFLKAYLKTWHPVHVLQMIEYEKCLAVVFIKVAEPFFDTQCKSKSFQGLSSAYQVCNVGTLDARGLF